MAFHTNKGFKRMVRDNVQRGQLPPNWRNHINDEEKQRLGVINERLERVKERESELFAERRLIMMRAIRRMRRKEGKT